MAKRLQAMGVERYRKGFNLTLQPDLIDQPLKWRRPRMIFVNSMSDLFHEDIPFSFINRIFETMNECPQHIFQILTKRSERLSKIANKLPWAENIWMGVSVENAFFTKRIEHLRTVPAHVRFLSCEPLLGPINQLPLQGIHWVIVGGESGPKARPMRKEWIESILIQCRRQGVKFFFKQWGGSRKDLTGRSLNGRVYSEMPSRLQVRL